MAPAIAPDVLTPRIKRADAANPTVTSIASQIGPPAGAIEAVKALVIEPESCMVNAARKRCCWSRSLQI
jgi:hypothetical protein